MLRVTPRVPDWGAVGWWRPGRIRGFRGQCGNLGRELLGLGILDVQRHGVTVPIMVSLHQLILPIQRLRPGRLPPAKRHCRSWRDVGAIDKLGGETDRRW